ncbi:MAG: glycoside hydrolase family 3 C-terminal domain-containing protein [Eubacteriales bacterium]
MLKHNDIISQLSERDKITLLTDIGNLPDELQNELGIPKLSVGDIEDFCYDDLPSPAAMVNTWNIPLISKVAGLSAARAKQNGVNFVEIPRPMAKINPYRTALSEDPMLAMSVSKAYVDAADNEKVACGIDGFGIKKDEVEFLDRSPDKRFLREFIVRPFSNIADKTESIAVIPEKDISDGEYSEVNFSLLKQIESGEICRGKHAVYNKSPAEKTVPYLQHRASLINGSSPTLETALNNYKKLQSNIEHGTSTVENLNDEVLLGKAISPETLDETVDVMLDFLFAIKQKSDGVAVGNSCDSEICLRAVLESAVLLKNSHSLLPLGGHLRVCAIGDIVHEKNSGFIEELKTYIESKGNKFIGFSRGYDIECDRSSELILAAINLAREADVVLLFLGLGEKREKSSYKTKTISIPANQQELLSKLSALRHKIVAITPPEACVDIVLTDNCAAIMQLPIDLADSASALAMLISGDFNPCGKLASTVYTNTDREYIKYKTCRERDGIKTASFIGYRYYDTAGEGKEFPFGHGLGYTKFDYADLKLTENSASFTVKNRGNRAGNEIVQVYIGKNDPGVIRAKRELCAFAKVHLGPKEKKEVTLTFEIPEVYDSTKDVYAKEFGDYTVYVGASIQDIRLQGQITCFDGDILNDHEYLSDYIHSISNISKDNFKLEAAIPTMKRSIFNLAAGALALCMALILKMYCFFEGFNTGFLDWFSILLAGLGIVFFIVEAIRRSRIDAEEKNNIDKLNQENFNEAEQISTYSANKMFADEFDILSENVAHQADIRIADTDTTNFAYIDKEQSFELAAHDFETFAYERGVKISLDASRRIFASLSASRLLVLNPMVQEDFEKLILVLSNYLETSPFIDKVDDTYIDSSHVLFGSDSNGTKTQTQFGYAIEAAVKVPQHIHIAAMTGVVAENLSMYFNPFVNYAKNPLGACYVPVVDDRHVETTVYLPPNVWFVLNLAEGESADKLPDYVAEIATVGSIEILPCEPSDSHSYVHPFSFYQLDYLVEKSSAKFVIDEDTWKKIDHIEEYVSTHTQFKIGNKMWLCLERYAHVFMACGGDRDAAIDEAIAAKLVPAMVSALKNRLAPDDRNLSDTIEVILGEERANACKELIYECELASARAEEKARRLEEDRLAAEKAEADKIAAERAKAERITAEQTAGLAETAGEAEGERPDWIDKVTETEDNSETEESAETEESVEAEESVETEETVEPEESVNTEEAVETEE